MANGSIKVVTRSTYDNLPTIENDTLYFVLEIGADADSYLSLYMGSRKQSDIADLNSILDLNTIDINGSNEDIFNSSYIPSKDLLTTNKLYYWLDENINAYKVFIKNPNNDEVLTLYSSPVWEEL